MTKLTRRVTTYFTMLLSGMAAGCSSNGPGPKTEQAIGGGTMAVGAVVTVVAPPVGIPIVIVGAAVTVHGAHREESGGGK